MEMKKKTHLEWLQNCEKSRMHSFLGVVTGFAVAPPHVWQETHAERSSLSSPAESAGAQRSLRGTWPFTICSLSPKSSHEEILMETVVLCSVCTSLCLTVSIRLWLNFYNPHHILWYWSRRSGVSCKSGLSYQHLVLDFFLFNKKELFFLLL